MDNTDIPNPERIEQQRDNVYEELKDHLNQISKAVYRVTDQQYGKHKLRIDDGRTYTLKHEKGSVEWFRDDETETYLISTKGRPTPSELAHGLEGYPDYVEAFSDWIRSQEQTIQQAAECLESVEEEIELPSAESLIEKRDDLVVRFWDLADDIASDVAEIKGNEYATLTLEVDGEMWKLKSDGNGASYLQVGGNYVLGRNSPSPLELSQALENLNEWLAVVDQWYENSESQLELTIPAELHRGE